MRKLNGITINGEYLGNSVVINGMFRAICTISPVIMRDFVQIINKIERLDEAVKINNFNCGFDSIDIEFKNSNAKGIASLYFKLINGEPELTDCRLIIDDKEYSTLSETIMVPELMSTQAEVDISHGNNLSEEEIARRQKISELKAKKLEQLRQEKGLSAARGSNLTGMNSMGRGVDTSAKNEGAPKSRLEELLEKKRKIEEAKAGKLSNSSLGTGYQSQTAADISGNIDDNGINNAKSSSATAKQGGGVSELSGENLDGNTSASSAIGSDAADMKENDLSNDVNTYNNTSSLSKFGNLEDIDIDSLSDEELAELEAELEAEMEAEQSMNDDYSSGSDNLGNYPGGYGFDRDFAQTLSQGLVDGLTQGLSQGLAQGLAQGLSQGLGNFSNQGFDNSWNSGGNSGNFASDFNSNSQNFGMPNTGGANSGGFDFAQSGDQSFGASSAQGANNTQYQQLPPDYNRIDNMNADAAMAARDYYDYDENSDPDDLSDLYSDFYEENIAEDSVEQGKTATTKNKGPETSEVDALKAELEALRAEAEIKKDLMTLEEFRQKQRELEEAKEKKRRQKLRIVGSRERVNASALDGGVFVAGNKVYKWGDTKILDS